MPRHVRTIASYGTVLALVLAGCVPDPTVTAAQVVAETLDGQEITVECRTDRELSHGDCGGWAASALRGDPDNVLDVTDAARMVLTGVIAPGPDQDRCQADLFDTFGRHLRSLRVLCYVPSGG